MERAENQKIALIKEHFAPLIGQPLKRYETAELKCGDGDWDEWRDLPIRLFFGSVGLVSVSWSRFDDLWLSSDQSLPFPVESDKTRWKENIHPKLNSALGGELREVSLGKGEMTIETREIPIWTRLLFDLGGQWLEVFNSLDENGYDLHSTRPVGAFTQCTQQDAGDQPSVRVERGIGI